MSKHTPWPWIHEGQFYVRIGDGSLSTQRTGRPGALVSERDANARLIAAAPDLLYELEYLVQLLEPAIRDGRVSVPGLATLNGARAAIAKASA